jgi:hypothetical protein
MDLRGDAVCVLFQSLNQLNDFCELRMGAASFEFISTSYFLTSYNRNIADARIFVFGATLKRGPRNGVTYKSSKNTKRFEVYFICEM